MTLSSDGNTLAVGAPQISGETVGGAGEAYVFIRNGDVWSQQAHVEASNPDEYDLFGGDVALSGDGNTLAVGAIGEDSNATGIDGNQADNGAVDPEPCTCSSATAACGRRKPTWRPRTPKATRRRRGRPLRSERGVLGGRQRHLGVSACRERMAARPASTATRATTAPLQILEPCACSSATAWCGPRRPTSRPRTPRSCGTGSGGA